MKNAFTGNDNILVDFYLLTYTLVNIHRYYWCYIFPTFEFLQWDYQPGCQRLDGWTVPGLHVYPAGEPAAWFLVLRHLHVEQLLVQQSESLSMKKTIVREICYHHCCATLYNLHVYNKLHKVHQGAYCTHNHQDSLDGWTHCRNIYSPHGYPLRVVR